MARPSKHNACQPISLLYRLGKLTEDVIMREIQHKLAKMLEPSLYAYQPKLVTIDALIQYTEDSKYHLDKPTTKYGQSASLDFFNVFDRLQPCTLLSKMDNYEFGAMSNFLCNRIQNPVREIRWLHIILYKLWGQHPSGYEICSLHYGSFTVMTSRQMVSTNEVSCWHHII